MWSKNSRGKKSYPIIFLCFLIKITRGRGPRGFRGENRGVQGVLIVEDLKGSEYRRIASPQQGQPRAALDDSVRQPASEPGGSHVCRRRRQGYAVGGAEAQRGALGIQGLGFRVQGLGCPSVFPEAVVLLPTPASAPEPNSLFLGFRVFYPPTPLSRGAFSFNLTNKHNRIQRQLQTPKIPLHAFQYHSSINHPHKLSIFLPHKINII